MARSLAWALAAIAAAQTSPKALAESTLAAPNATNASETCDVIVRIGYPEHRLARTPTRHSPPSSGARSRSRLCTPPQSLSP